MDRTERFMKIDLLLQRRKASLLVLKIEEFEDSRARVNRNVEPLRQRIHESLEYSNHSVEEIAARINISDLAERPVDADVFKTIPSTLPSRKRIILQHYHRGKDIEFIQDVMQYGPDMEVLSPDIMRETIRSQSELAAEFHR